MRNFVYHQSSCYKFVILTILCFSATIAPSHAVAIPGLSSVPGIWEELLQPQADELKHEGVNQQRVGRGRHSREMIFTSPAANIGNIVFEDVAQEAESFELRTRSFSGQPDLGGLVRATTIKPSEIKTTVQSWIVFPESEENTSEVELRTLIQTPRKKSKKCRNAGTCGRTLAQNNS
ncbi:unnamed protein product [Allacma fusca]|uniref:Uncharacterized protein n=1 Tax=Allacma fusca TaxID=39272 RepID=A0A8J2P455_9HEXA|nr:unnamed protein product [Allacma fusca]